MDDLFRKFLYTGVGLVSNTAEKLQKNLNELIDKGKISEEEGKKVVDDLLEDTNSKREEFEGKLRSIIDGVLGKLDLPTRDEVESLRSRIAELEGELASEKTAKKTTTTSTRAKKKPADDAAKK